MRFEEIDEQDQHYLQAEIDSRMREVSSSYHFPNDNVKSEPLTDIEIDSLGLDLPSNPEFQIEVTPAMGILVKSRDGSVLELDFNEIKAKRKANLINETRLVNAADDPNDKVIKNIVAECGYSLDIKTLLKTAKEYGLNECWGARPSCGAADLIVEHDDFIEANIATIGFRTPDGDRVEVLYLGRYTSDIEFIHQAVIRLASMPEFDFRILGIEDI